MSGLTTTIPQRCVSEQAGDDFDPDLSALLDIAYAHEQYHTDQIRRYMRPLLFHYSQLKHSRKVQAFLHKMIPVRGTT